MVEIEIAGVDEGEASDRAISVLRRLGGKFRQECSVLNPAGIGPLCWAYEMPSGEFLQVWYDEWIGTSLRGESASVEQYAKRITDLGRHG